MAIIRNGLDKPANEQKLDEIKLKAILEYFNYDKAKSSLELKIEAIKIKPEELALRLRDALLCLNIAHLDLTLAQIAVTAENESNLGNLNMNLQESLLAEVTEHLTKANCNLKTLTLDGWDVVGLVGGKQGIDFKKQHKSKILKDLGQAVRANSSLTELSLESSQFTSANIKTFFQCLYENLKDEKPNKGQSQLAAIELYGNIDPSTDDAKEIEELAEKTHINIRWGQTNKLNQSSAPFSPTPPKNGNQKKSPGEVPAANAANNEAKPLGTLDNDDRDDEPPRNYGKGLMHAFLHAFKKRSASRYAKLISGFGFGGLLVGGGLGGLAALGGFIGTTTGAAAITLLGVTLSATGVGLIVGGIILGALLIAGIAYGIYQAEKEHREVVLRGSSSANILAATGAEIAPPASVVAAPKADERPNSAPATAAPKADERPDSAPATAASDNGKSQAPTIM